MPRSPDSKGGKILTVCSSVRAHEKKKKKRGKTKLTKRRKDLPPGVGGDQNGDGRATKTWQIARQRRSLLTSQRSKVQMEGRKRFPSEEAA